MKQLNLDVNLSLSSRPHLFTPVSSHLQILTPSQDALQKQSSPKVAYFPYCYRTLNQASLQGRRLLVLLGFGLQLDTVHPGGDGIAAVGHITIQSEKPRLDRRWDKALKAPPPLDHLLQLIPLQRSTVSTPSNWKSLFSKLKSLCGGCSKVWSLESVIS